MSKQQKWMKGSCLCGEIQYAVAHLEERIGHCHCTMCRKFHGAAFSTFGEVKQNNFKWIKGEALLQSFTAPNGSVRQFCKNCGSSMTFSESKDSTSLIEFSLATLDEDIQQKPDAHIFLANKASWSDINDSLLKYQHKRE